MVSPRNSPLPLCIPSERSQAFLFSFSSLPFCPPFHSPTVSFCVSLSLSSYFCFLYTLETKSWALQSALLLQYPMPSIISLEWQLQKYGNFFQPNMFIGNNFLSPIKINAGHKTSSNFFFRFIDNDLSIYRLSLLLSPGGIWTRVPWH